LAVRLGPQALFMGKLSDGIRRPDRNAAIDQRQVFGT
jgi:hypothetical protein